MKDLPHYSNIHDTPIYVFDYISKDETGEGLNNLFKDKNLTDEQKDKFDLVAIWKSIYHEYIDEFGWSDDFDTYTLYLLDATNLRAQGVETGDRSKFTLARAREAEAEALMADIEVVKLSEMAARVGKSIGSPINVMTTSVYQFYGYVKLMSDG